MARQPLTAWNAEQVRLTVFHPARAVAPSLWADLFGSEPEQIIENPRTAQWQAEGAIEQGRVLVLQQPTQTSVVLLCTPTSIGTSQVSAEVAVDRILEAAKPWVSSLNYQPSRLALGVVAFLTVASREQGYLALREYVAATPDPGNCFDFTFQINRRRESRTVPGLQVNRLAKWSVAQARTTSIVVTPQGLSQINEVGPLINACRAELDVNTDPGTTAEEGLQADRAEGLTLEFRDLAFELLREGDIQ